MTSIVVPLDGSPLAESALDAVAPLARCGDVDLWLVRVVSPAHPVFAEGRMLMTADEVTGLHRSEAAAYLQRQVAALAARGLRARGRVVVGEPAAAIVAEAAGAGCSAIVMATHGRTGLSRVLLGSVAEAVIKASRVPVLAVHRPGAAEGG
jgi:nucleotide-binding universal stress UspA family protein